MKIQTKTSLIDAKNISSVGKHLKFDRKCVYMLSEAQVETALDRIMVFFKKDPDGVFDISPIERANDRLRELQRLINSAKDTNSLHTYEYEYARVWQELSYEFSKL